MIPLDGSVVKKIKPVGKRAELCLMIVVIPHVVQGHVVLHRCFYSKQYGGKHGQDSVLIKDNLTVKNGTWDVQLFLYKTTYAGRFSSCHM